MRRKCFDLGGSHPEGLPRRGEGIQDNWMKSANIGVIEGFFGPEWSWQSRTEICSRLKAIGADFYIYAPKRDPFLRKQWTLSHPQDHWQHLTNLRAHCRQSKIKFGLGLSPFEVHEHWNETSKNQLKEKIKKLSDLDLDYLGLFFDDMLGAPGLAEKQAEMVDLVESVSSYKIIFCPTYYTPDPILDKVFGERPQGYLEYLGNQLSSKVEILWTGPKVISPEIDSEGLKEVTKILKRKPFIWDNYFANDGPKQCHFLKIKPLLGRDQSALHESAGWAFNLMNQPFLSEVMLELAIQTIQNSDQSKDSFWVNLEKTVGTEMKFFIEKNHEDLTKVGWSNLSETKRSDLKKQLPSNDPNAKDIIDWLDGQYLVGPECLTD